MDRLTEIAPGWVKSLQGRVSWAIDKLYRQSPGNGKVAGGSDDKGSPTGALHADGLAARTRQAEAVSE